MKYKLCNPRRFEVLEILDTEEQADQCAKNLLRKYYFIPCLFTEDNDERTVYGGWEQPSITANKLYKKVGKRIEITVFHRNVVKK
jgi:hypothetical protein